MIRLCDDSPRFAHTSKKSQRRTPNSSFTHRRRPLTPPNHVGLEGKPRTDNLTDNSETVPTSSYRLTIESDHHEVTLPNCPVSKPYVWWRY